MERRRGDGRVDPRLNEAGVWCLYVRWWKKGKDKHLSVAKELHKPPEQVTWDDAEKLLRRKIREKWAGTDSLPRSKRVTMRAVFATYRTHLAFKAQVKLGKWAHLPAHLLEYKRRSLRKTLRAVDAVERWFGDEPVPTYARLEAVATEQLKSHTTGTVRARFALVHAALKQAADVELIEKVPRFPELEAGAARDETITGEEHGRIQSRLPDAVAQDLGEFRWGFGCRPSEPLLLTWPMLRTHPIPHFWLPLTKTEKGRLFVIRQPQIVALIDRRKKKDRRLDCLFVFHRNGRPIAYDTVREEFAEAAAAAGLPEKHLQDYRRARYDRFAAAGVDDEDARGIVGHDDVHVASKHYNVKSVLRQAAALDRETAFLNPRKTRAGGPSEEPDSPS